MKYRIISWLTVGNMAWLAALSTLTAAASGDGVKVTQKPDRVSVEVNGEFFTDFWFQGNQHPAKIKKKGSNEENDQPTRKVYFWPIHGPGGRVMSRQWPIIPDSKNEEHDHPHHRGLWFSHGSVNGIDFWAEDAKAGRIVHEKFVELKSGAQEGLIKSQCKWVAPDNKVVCTDERVFRVYNRPANERLFDYEITLKAPGDREVVLGDTKEGTLAIRLAETMRLSMGKNKPGKGRIVQDTGVENDKTWGKQAKWCDYSGPVDGQVVGVAIFDHPSNPVHPTWWHVRDYGLFAANPFGVHDFEKKEPGTGNLVIAAGKSVTFKYRFYLHEGDEKQAKVAERYQEYGK